MISADRWQIVLARDPGYDGKLFYGVRTTGVYCRPSCPSRRPRPDSVEFFATSAEAELAGYRPCKRCEPTQANAQVRTVQAMRRFIDRNAGRKITLKELARRAGLSPFYLQRLFKKLLGVTPKEYQDSRRMVNFKSALNSNGKIVDAVYESGYGSSSRIYERTNRQLGMTPGEYRRKGEGIVICYAFAESKLGRMLIAATGKGICRLRFGGDDAAMARELGEEFGAATLRRDDRGLERFTRVITNYLAGLDKALDLPLDMRATIFQDKVWKALRGIPYGTTATYSEIARKVGNPKAVRPVARACATNPVALAVPCHRVVREDGDLAGYRWGLERKAKLLAIEKSGS